MLRRKIAAALAVVTATSLLIAPQALAAPTQQIQWQQCFAPGTPGLPPGGERLRIRSADACRFDAAGRIMSLRAFWGPEDIEPA